MRNALIGAFVLSVMLAPLAAHGDDLVINSGGACHVLTAAETHMTFTAGTTVTVGLKPNGGATARCRVEVDSPGEDSVDFDSNSRDEDCIIISGTFSAVADEWQQTISPQGKLMGASKNGPFGMKLGV